MPDDRREFEIVVVAPHSGLRSPLLQTDRMLAAVTAPGVHILGHPRGRMYGSRPGVSADWPAVFAAAARGHVAVEIDGDPSRQDLDFVLARAAVDAGCVFALNSDAHSVGDWPSAEIALAHASLNKFVVNQKCRFHPSIFKMAHLNDATEFDPPQESPQVMVGHS